MLQPSTRNLGMLSGSAMVASVWLVAAPLGSFIIAGELLESPKWLFASPTVSFGALKIMQIVVDTESGSKVTIPLALRDTLKAPEPLVSSRTGRKMSPLEATLERTHPLRDSSVAKLGQIRDSVVAQEAQRQGVPTLLALAVSHVEDDRGIPWVVSPGGDIGVMQVNSNVHKQVPKRQLADPGINARVGVGILKRYFQRYGSWDKALRAYNGALKYQASGNAYVAAVSRQMNALAGDSTYARTALQDGQTGPVPSQLSESTNTGPKE